ncbi:MAG: hypothetical protein H6R17_2976 [Proteobacteria bacterium]|nr:hypothetical protein [Pseudomonadota bacterium]
MSQHVARKRFSSGVTRWRELACTETLALKVIK